MRLIVERRWPSRARHTRAPERIFFFVASDMFAMFSQSTKNCQIIYLNLLKKGVKGSFFWGASVEAAKLYLVARHAHGFFVWQRPMALFFQSELLGFDSSGEFRMEGSVGLEGALIGSGPVFMFLFGFGYCFRQLYLEALIAILLNAESSRETHFALKPDTHPL